MCKKMASALAALILSTLIGASHSQESEGKVQFRIQALTEPAHIPNQTEWLATFESRGSEAQFIISIETSALPAASHQMFAKGAIIHVAGSEPAVFLQALSRALHAKGSSPSLPRVSQLNVGFAILGTKQTRISPTGGFRSNPQGKWIATKLFVADGEGEVYLNLDPDDGIGEFSLKDEGYGDMVVRELSRVI